jgi:hypothetical protein
VVLFGPVGRIDGARAYCDAGARCGAGADRLPVRLEGADAACSPERPRCAAITCARLDRISLTTERHDRLAAHGVLTLHFPPKRIKTDAPGTVSELQSAIDMGLARPRLPITAVRQAA